MSSVLEWIRTNPVLFSAVIWPAITAVFTLIFKPRSAAEYAQLPPRVGAFLRLMGAIGFDVPKALESLRVLLTGAPPAPPVPPNVQPPPDEPTPPETPLAKLKAATMRPPSLRAMSLLAAGCFALAGCGLLRPVEPVIGTIDAIITDAQEAAVLVNIAAEAYFGTHPELADARGKYEAIYQRVHVALDFAIRTLNGVTDLDQSKLDVAFADFKTAYSDLAAFLKSFGITVPTGHYLASSEHPPVAPVPLVYTVHASK